MLETLVYVDIFVVNVLAWALFWAAFFPWILVIPFQTMVTSPASSANFIRAGLISL